jgi:two-component system NtrC family response regulator
MGIIGNSPQLMAALQMLAEAAASNVNVLLLGETGVGKELFAHALHKNSTRAAHPFVTVDCAALPASLVESHLFGHAKGAFTGADRSRDGLLVAAHQGTLFLDEVGDLPAVIQGSFLRALELRRFRPVGDVREVESQFRLVAATNRDLEQLAALDLFRNDLLFRLRGISIHIPPLRDRAEDIPDLARHAVMRFCAQHAMPVKEIADGCLNLLLSYAWPGNVRELFHTMARACVAAGHQDRIFAAHLPTELRVAVARRKADAAPQAVLPGQERPSRMDMPSLREWKTRAEAMYVEQVLEHCQGDMRKAADIAGLSRGHMYELLKKHGKNRE